MPRRVGQRGDLDQLSDAATPADIGLQDVGATHLTQHPEPVSGGLVLTGRGQHSLRQVHIQLTDEEGTGFLIASRRTRRPLDELGASVYCVIDRLRGRAAYSLWAAARIFTMAATAACNLAGSITLGLGGQMIKIISGLPHGLMSWTAKTVARSTGVRFPANSHQ